MSSTAPTLAFPHPVLTKIIGQPSNTSITVLTREIYANAHAIPSLRGGGAHGHLGMVMSDAAYQLLTTVAFTLPNHPGANPNHPSGATSTQIQESIRAFNSVISELSLATTICEELKKQLILAVDQLYLAALKDPIFGFATVTVIDMINHLSTTYGTLTCSDFEKNWASISSLWTPNEPIELLWERLREVCCIATAGNDTISDTAAINLTHLLFESTGVFTHACDNWLTLAAANCTFTEFQSTFTAANKEHLQCLTTSKAEFHSANAAATVPLASATTHAPQLLSSHPAWPLPMTAPTSFIAGPMVLVSTKTTPVPPVPSLPMVIAKQPQLKTCVAATTPLCQDGTTQNPTPHPIQLPMLPEGEGSR